MMIRFIRPVIENWGPSIGLFLDTGDVVRMLEAIALAADCCCNVTGDLGDGTVRVYIYPGREFLHFVSTASREKLETIVCEVFTDAPVPPAEDLRALLDNLKSSAEEWERWLDGGCLVLAVDTI